eukprot:1195926-Pleurochrysis_carterae.AAC.1
MPSHGNKSPPYKLWPMRDSRRHEAYFIIVRDQNDMPMVLSSRMKIACGVHADAKVAVRVDALQCMRPEKCKALRANETKRGFSASKEITFICPRAN